MLFVDFAFLPFFLTVFVVHWSLRNHRARKVWLLGASYFFYGAWDWRFLSLILASTLVDYVVGRKLEHAVKRKRWLLLSLTANLGLLGAFKYFDFFLDSGVALLNLAGFDAHESTLRIILPVGISFYTFQTLSYSIDVYRKKLTPTRNVLDLALFVAFFPQLVAGPIIRAVDFLPQLRIKTVFARADVRAAFVLFFVGFVKKACISDGIAHVPDEYFAHPERYDVFSAWIATLFYAVQIYCDFSGYSDMAIACAALLGYELCVNFQHPYFAADITAFWRRWHISLSTWLRDYLYIPLGGNRGSRLFTHRNLILTMLLGGLWHGAGWNFVMWGALHGIALVVHRTWKSAIPVDAPVRGVTRWLAPPLTFLFVCFCWIFFRAASFSDALIAVRGFCLFDAAGEARVSSFGPWHAAGLLALLTTAHWITARRSVEPLWRRVPGWAFALGLSAAVALALPFVPLEAKPFIYFQF